MSSHDVSTNFLLRWRSLIINKMLAHLQPQPNCPSGFCVQCLISRLTSFSLPKSPMASQNPLAPLEKLPTEILQMILSQMDCTHDLSSAIRASPDLFQAFLGSREQILIRVIQSSLNQDIFMEVLGLLHVPNFSGLHHVPRRLYSPSREEWFDPYSSWDHDPNDSWRVPLRREQMRLTRVFQRYHFLRLDLARFYYFAPRPFPVPEVRQPADEDRVAEFRRSVNTVVEVFGLLKRHMEQTHERTRYAPGRYRCLWVPSGSDPGKFGLDIDGTKNAQQIFSLDEQRKYLRDLVREKMRIKYD